MSFDIVGPKFRDSTLHYRSYVQTQVTQKPERERDWKIAHNDYYLYSHKTQLVKTTSLPKVAQFSTSYQSLTTFEHSQKPNMTQDFGYPQTQIGGYPQGDWMQSPANNQFNQSYPAFVQNSPHGSHPSSSPPRSPEYPHSVPSRNNLVHQSPMLSPGDWNVASPMPGSVTTSAYDSSQYSTSPYDSPGHSLGGQSYNSAPAGTCSSVSSGSTAPRLPSDLGQKECLEYREIRVRSNSSGHGLATPSDLDIRREKIALAKAKKLLDQGVGSAGGHYEETERPRVRTSSLSVRQAAIRRYEEKHMYGVSEEQENERPPTNSAEEPTTFVTGRKEELAQSNRKGKNKPEELETVHDYKCKLDRDRENFARNMALTLLDGKVRRFA
jgi:hypothetical protein